MDVNKIVSIRMDLTLVLVKVATDLLLTNTVVMVNHIKDLNLSTKYH